MIKSVFIIFLKSYKYFISPFITPTCRFLPTCSEYAADAYKKHGFFLGSILTLKRLLRCNPWGGKGYDPVPPEKDNCFKNSHIK